MSEVDFVWTVAIPVASLLGVVGVVFVAVVWSTYRAHVKELETAIYKALDFMRISNPNEGSVAAHSVLTKALKRGDRDV